MSEAGRGSAELARLEELARACGVMTRYRGPGGSIVRAGPEALLAVLRALGTPLTRVGDAPGALREARERRWRRALEPVLLADAHGNLAFHLRLPGAEAKGRALVTVETLEEAGGGGGPVHGAGHGPRSGERRFRAEVDLGALRRAESAQVEGSKRVALDLRLSAGLPQGYHRLRVEAAGRQAEATIIVAPASAPPWPGGERGWGLFLPLHAAWSREGPATGTFGMLGDLAAWAGGLGAGFFGTLPLMAAFLDEPFEPSPYAPVSRLFLNELHVDPRAVPELAGCEAARALAEGAAGPGAPSDLVDHRGEMFLRRRVLSRLAEETDRLPQHRARAFRRFAESEPELEGYARFRAATERQGRPWPQWPASLRDGLPGGEDVDPAAVRYHRYAQWVAREQLEEASRRAHGAGACLYLDAPLGVHPEGYDAWRWRHLFAEGVSAGAPPDSFFTGGQAWGFRPPHPERSREDGHAYFALGLRKAMAHAGLLRVDHVMALHRIFWVPEGARPTEGVYVNYPSDEMHAVLRLEARRAACAVVGEDLGTVPGEVRSEMARRRLLRMHVLQIEAEAAAGAEPCPPPPLSIATLNTHDMPTFSAFWRALDLDDRAALGLLPPEEEGRLRARREKVREALRRLARRTGAGAAEEERAALEGALLHLASAGPALLQIALEDLWQETRPQNVPGTSAERPNWRRRASRSVEEILSGRDLAGLLGRVRRAREIAPEERGR